MPSSWNTVRVFLSSTFRDMHAERDHLIKVTFPALREKLLPYRVELYDIDLRWGITEGEAKNEKVIGLCLEQVDECRPFFLAFLGHRYGWVPGRIPADVEEAVNQWREAIARKLPGGNEAARRDHEALLAGHGGRVRQLIWEPIQKQLTAAIRTVYLAPDAGLTPLPWAALPGQARGNVLLDEYALAILPHGPFLLEQLTPSPPRSASRLLPEGLLLVGGVRYDDKPTTMTVAARSADSVIGAKVEWPYLQGTDQERRLIEKLLDKAGPKVMAGLNASEASVDRLRKELSRARFAHIATHGFFADKQFRSALQLDEKLFERRMFQDGGIGERIGEGARSPLVLSGLVLAGPTATINPIAASSPATPSRGCCSTICSWLCSALVRQDWATWPAARECMGCSAPFTSPAARTSSPACGKWMMPPPLR